MSLPVSSGIIGLIFIICYVVITSKIIVHHRSTIHVPAIINTEFRYSSAPTSKKFNLILLSGDYQKIPEEDLDNENDSIVLFIQESIQIGFPSCNLNQLVFQVSVLKEHLILFMCNFCL